jgi:hypothetical protein
MKVISGGQTGVDRAALDAALELGLDCGGWCPRGRRSETGTIPACYPLQETPTSEYPERTEWNVLESDATLILTRGQPDGGTALTRKLARKHNKPCKVVNLLKPAAPQIVATWLVKKRVETLNVAGPRESSQKGIGRQAKEFLTALLRLWRQQNNA